MVKVFISYSHRDDELRAELETHLSLLKRQGTIDTWYDRAIGAGEEIDSRIQEALEEADIVVLLVSPYFLASNYCYDIEMRRAMERHVEGTARVIPVILHPCEWDRAPFSKLMAVPRDGSPVSTFANRHEAFLQITRAIREAATALHPRQPKSDAPPTPARTRQASPSIGGAAHPSVRVRRKFTDRDRDEFLEGAFDSIAQFFKTSLSALARDNPHVETKFKRIDADHFSAVAYVEGNVQSYARVAFGGRESFSGGIRYSNSETGGDNGFNEALYVEDDGYALLLKPLGMASRGANEPLSVEQAAEYLWEMFLSRLR